MTKQEFEEKMRSYDGLEIEVDGSKLHEIGVMDVRYGDKYRIELTGEYRCKSSCYYKKQDYFHDCVVARLKPLFGSWKSVAAIPFYFIDEEAQKVPQAL